MTSSTIPRQNSFPWTFSYRWSRTARFQLFGLFLLVLGVRIIAFSFSQNFAYDAVDRIALAQRWLEHPFFITDAWLPQQHTIMPIYLIGIAMGLWKDPFITPRAVSLVLGSLSAVPFFLLVRILFDRTTAVYSTLLFAVFTLHVQCSVVASSEAPFIFFMLFCLYFLFRFKETEKIRTLISSALFLNAACMTRYTGWIYIPLLCCLVPRNMDDLKQAVLLRSKTTGYLFLFGLLSSAFPLFWMIGNYSTFGDPLYPIHITTNYTLNLIKYTFINIDPLMKAMGYQLYYLAYWPGVIFLSMTPVIALFAFFGMAYSIYRRQHLSLIILFAGVYLYFVYKIMTKTFILLPRFTLDSTILILPFAVVGINKFLSYFDRSWKILLTGFISVSVIASVSAIVWLSETDASPLGSMLSKVSPLSRLSGFQEDIISFLNVHTTAQDKVILDHDKYWAEKEIMFYSHLQAGQFVANLEDLRSEEKFLKIIDHERPKYLIYNHGGFLPAILNGSRKDQVGQSHGLRFQPVYTANPYLIYRIEYGGSDQ